MGESAHRPLQGKRVVVTRSAEQSRALAEALREAGAEPVLLPLLAFTSPENVGELDACLSEAVEFDWIFFTSQNAVRAVQERCLALGQPAAKLLEGTKVAAVGPATAEAARDAGLQVAYVSRVHNGVALVGELAAEVRGKRVFLPRSDRANPDLITALEEHGASVKAVVAYKTTTAGAELEKVAAIASGKCADAVLFFSPSAVHYLREILDGVRFLEFGRRAVFVAIGPVSEKALREEGVKRVLVPADTTVAAVISTLAEYFGKTGQAQPAGAKSR